MSISAMSEAKLVREHPNERSPNALEKALGLDKLVERPKSSADETPEPTGVPEGITRRLVRWIPTETITVYLADDTRPSTPAGTPDVPRGIRPERPGHDRD